MNKVTLIGRLTKDADVRYNGETQMAVARFSLAIDRFVKDGEKKTDFPSCVAFGRTAENLERFSGKGLRVAVEGRIQTGSYTDKDGKTVYTTDVIADRVEFIDWKQKDGQNENMGVPEGFQALTDDDIPF